MWVEYSFWRFYIVHGSVTMVQYHLANSDVEKIKEEGNKLLQDAMGFKDEIYNVIPSRFEQGVYICQVCEQKDWGY